MEWRGVEWRGWIDDNFYLGRDGEFDVLNRCGGDGDGEVEGLRFLS